MFVYLGYISRDYNEGLCLFIGLIVGFFVFKCVFLRKPAYRECTPGKWHRNMQKKPIQFWARSPMLIWVG